MAVLAAIYTERLLKRHPTLRLTKKNWRPLLIAALHLASKTWEDVHAWNSDFSVYHLRVAIGLDYPVRSLHRLELQILTGLDYRMEISGELYASYYFALTEEIQRSNTPPHLLNESLLASSLGQTAEANSTMASERDIQSLCGSPTPSSSSAHRAPWNRIFMSHARTRRMSRTLLVEHMSWSSAGRSNHQGEASDCHCQGLMLKIHLWDTSVMHRKHQPLHLTSVRLRPRKVRIRGASGIEQQQHYETEVSWQLAVDSMLKACKSTVLVILPLTSFILWEKNRLLLVSAGGDVDVADADSFMSFCSAPWKVISFLAKWWGTRKTMITPQWGIDGLCQATTIFLKLTSSVSSHFWWRCFLFAQFLAENSHLPSSDFTLLVFG